MSINWRELKAAQLTLQAFLDLNNMTVLIQTDNTTSLSYINKQGRSSIIALDGTIHSTLEVVSSERNSSDGSTCPRGYELGSRLRIPSDFCQKSMEAEDSGLSQTITDLRPTLYRPVCLPDHPPPSEIRIMDA